MHIISRIALLETFTCLGEHCPDTCCRHWSMQLDDATFAKYEKDAPELVSAVAEEDGLRVMRREGASQECVKLQGGLCGIHKEYGSHMLGDACYFYPRITRSLGGRTVMSATMSCPEIARLAIIEGASTAPGQGTAEVERLPRRVKEYLPEGISAEDAWALHEFFLRVIEDESLPPQQALLRIHSVVQSLMRVAPSQWRQAVEVFWQLSEASLPSAVSKEEDPFNLLHALCGIALATRKTLTPQLSALIGTMQQTLKMEVKWDDMSLRLQPDAHQAHKNLLESWRGYAPSFTEIFRRWLSMQLSAALFPFAGLGENFAERALIIGVRMATLRLALQCACKAKGSMLDDEEIVVITQSLARLMDHLGDAEFLRKIYAETGWTRADRLGGLLANRF